MVIVYNNLSLGSMWGNDQMLLEEGLGRVRGVGVGRPHSEKVRFCVCLSHMERSVVNKNS